MLRSSIEIRVDLLIQVENGVGYSISVEGDMKKRFRINEKGEHF
jgi:hypothetical protein